MRKTLRVVAWFIKALLLIIALAALAMWPMSRGRAMEVYADRSSSANMADAKKAGAWLRYRVECRDGRLILVRYRRSWENEVPNWRLPASHWDNRWTWVARSQPVRWDDTEWSGKWGPIRWLRFARDDPDQRARFLGFAAPLWLVAIVIGAWPAWSLRLAVQRRLRLRRALRQGLCAKCGYDLRATPDQPIPPFKPGELLPVCPECGTEQERG